MLTQVPCSPIGNGENALQVLACSSPVVIPHFLKTMSDGSGEGAVIEIGRDEVWETVFVGDEN